MDPSPLNQPPVTALGGGKWLFAFLLCFTVAIYARPEDLFPALVPLHLTMVFGICVGLTYLGSLRGGKIRLIWTRELRIVLLLTLWYVAGVPWAYWRTGSLMVFEQVWLKTLLAFFLLTQTLVNLPRVRKLLWVIILSELVVTMFSIFVGSKAPGDAERLSGVSAGFLGWNFLGIAVSTTIPYIAVLFISKPRLFTRVILLVTLISTTWMLVLTASRGSILNIVLSVLLTSVLVLRVAPRGRILLVVLTCCLLVACMLAPRVLWERLGTLWGDTESSVVAASAAASTAQRTTLLWRSIEYTGRYPIFGLGLGNFGVFNGDKTGKEWLATHNAFTQISSEAGIPALVLFVALLVVVLRRMSAVGKIRPKTEDENELQLMARATLVSILSFVVGFFFANLAYDYYLFYIAAVGVGLQTIASTNRQLSAVLSSNSPLRIPLIPSVKNS